LAIRTFGGVVRRGRNEQVRERCTANEEGRQSLSFSDQRNSPKKNNSYGMFLRGGLSPFRSSGRD